MAHFKILISFYEFPLNLQSWQKYKKHCHFEISHFQFDFYVRFRLKFRKFDAWGMIRLFYSLTLVPGFKVIIIALGKGYLACMLSKLVVESFIVDTTCSLKVWMFFPPSLSDKWWVWVHCQWHASPYPWIHSRASTKGSYYTFQWENQGKQLSSY